MEEFLYVEGEYVTYNLENHNDHSKNEIDEQVALANAKQEGQPELRVEVKVKENVN